MQSDNLSDSDADSLYCADECSPPTGPAAPFGTVLAGEIAKQIDDNLDQADEEPSPNCSASDTDGDISASSSSYVESESSLEPVSIDKEFEQLEKIPVPSTDLSAVTLGKSTPSDDGEDDQNSVEPESNEHVEDPHDHFEQRDVNTVSAPELSVITLDKSTPSDGGEGDRSSHGPAQIDRTGKDFEHMDILADITIDERAINLKNSTPSDDDAAEDNDLVAHVGVDDLIATNAREHSPKPDTLHLRTSHITSTGSDSASDTRNVEVKDEEVMNSNVLTMDSDAQHLDSEGQEVDSDDDIFGVDTHVEDDGNTSDDTPPSSSTGGTYSSSGSVGQSEPKKNSIYPNSAGKRSGDSKSSTSSAKRSVVGSGFFGRASATFYKAFKKPTKSKDLRNLSTNPNHDEELPDMSSWDPEEALKMEKEEEMAHLKLEHHLTAQISTLRSAQSGFVDLMLLKPMTESTLAAIKGEARRILSELPKIEQRKDVVSRQFEQLKNTTEAELATKEQLLVGAKLKLAEARGEVQTLKHELYLAQKHINQPARIAARERYTLKVRREKAQMELDAANESREKMEQNLTQKQASLDHDTAEVNRLEKSVRDLEGDWA